MEKQIPPGESVTVAVTEAVSGLENRSLDTFQPLHEVIDTDLDEIFPFDETTQQTGQICRLTFEYLNYYVTIKNDRTLSIERKPEKPFAVQG